MAYEVSIDARYPRDADTVFAEAMQFAQVIEAIRGLAHDDGLPEGVAVEGETYLVDVTLLGVL